MGVVEVRHDCISKGGFFIPNQSQTPNSKRQLIFGVRAFPPGCGRDDQLDNLRPVKEAASESLPTRSLVENVMLLNGQTNKTELMNSKVFGTAEMIEPVEEEASVGTGEDLISRGKNGDGQGIEKLMVSADELGVATPKEEMVAVLSDRNSCSPQNQFISVSNPCRRIVSAVRDFPPLCGRNASMEATRKDARKHCIDKSPRGKWLDTSYLHNQLHTDFRSPEVPLSRVTVLGLMAASNCPFRKGKRVRKNKPDGGRSGSQQKKLHF